MNVCSPVLLLVVLPTRLSARCLLSSRPDTAFIRSCLLLPPGFSDTSEAGIEAGSRACFFFSFSSIGSARDGMWSLISDVCTVLDRIFWVRLGALKKNYVLLR